jgi:hypothetical protein
MELNSLKDEIKLIKSLILLTSRHINFRSIISWNTLYHVVRRYLESILRLTVIELFLIVKYFLYCTAHVVVQLLDQQLLFLIFLNPLRNKLVGPVDDVLVQLKLFFFPL